MSVNKVFLVGRLGKDPDVRHTPSGTVVATFALATTEQFNDRNGNRQERTEWHNIVAWRQLAEICGKYLHKGRQVYIEGKIQTRSYDDRDGNKRYITEIVADQMQMLGNRDDNYGNKSVMDQEDNRSQRDNVAREQKSSRPNFQENNAAEGNFSKDNQNNNFDESTFDPDDVPF